MATITVLETSAASAVGTDLMKDNRLRTSPYWRKVRAIGVVGSAAIADCSVDLSYGGEFRGNFYNTTAGASKIPTALTDLVPVGGDMWCPPGTPIAVLISDAGATNVIAVTLVIDEMPAGYRPVLAG